MRRSRLFLTTNLFQIQLKECQEASTSFNETIILWFTRVFDFPACTYTNGWWGGQR
jgi:hypothetical protein